jgi:polar amino acid transport system permease protein
VNQQIELIIHSLPLLLKGTLATLEIALAAIVLGVLGGLGLGILNSNAMHNKVTSRFIDSFVWAVRGTPLFVQVLIIYYALPELVGVSLSPFLAGVLALGINSSAYISEIIRGGINAIPQGQWEAAYIIGLSPAQTLRGIIVPQMFKITMPSIANELTSLIKETSILMVIGVGELTKVSKDIVARELDPMTIYLAAAILYLAMTSSISLILKYLKGETP